MYVRLDKDCSKRETKGTAERLLRPKTPQRGSAEIHVQYRHYEQQALDLSDALALDRTRLANERTFLAYLRAAIMLAVSAVSILKLLPQQRELVAVAWAMLPAAVGLAIFGAYRSLRLAKALTALEAEPAEG